MNYFIICLFSFFVFLIARTSFLIARIIHHTLSLIVIEKNRKIIFFAKNAILDASFMWIFGKK